MCLTPVVSKYKKENPEDKVSVCVKWPEIYLHNPYVDEILWTNNVENTAYDTVYNIRLPVSLTHRKISLQDASAEQVGITLQENEKKPQIFLSQRERIIWRDRFKRPKGLVVGFSPYARWSSREWPIQRWREVIAWIEEKYNATILYLGDSSRPYPWIGNNLGGQTDVRELALVLEQCDLLLTVDNGVAHLAAAVETPSVILFGPVMSETRVMTSLAFPVQAVGCVGCWTTGQVDAPPRVCPKNHNRCMLDIQTVAVVKTVEKAMKIIQASS
jgi:ADP-heptose:LPS heptosyltransferase